MVVSTLALVVIIPLTTMRGIFSRQNPFYRALEVVSRLWYLVIMANRVGCHTYLQSFNSFIREVHKFCMLVAWETVTCFEELAGIKV